MQEIKFHFLWINVLTRIDELIVSVVTFDGQRSHF